MQQGQPATPRHPTAPHGVLVLVAGPGTRGAGGFCASSTQRGLHLVRCCWGGPALGVTKHSTDGHVPGQVAVVTGLGHPGDTQPGAGSAKLCRLRPRHAGVHRCRLRGGQCTHTQTHAPPAGWDAQTHGCTDRRTHRGRQTDTDRQRHTHTHTQSHRRMDAEVHKHMRRQTRTGTHTDTESQTP